jgi:hypothetical protein
MIVLLPGILLVSVACGGPGSTVRTPEAPSIQAPVREVAVMDECKPLDDATMRAITGDNDRSKDVDEPSRAYGTDARIQGQCNANDVRRVLTRRAKYFLRCFDQIADVKTRTGRLVVRWELSPTGATKAMCRHEDRLGKAALSNCIYRTLKLTRFKSTSGRCLIQWPFVFRR